MPYNFYTCITDTSKEIQDMIDSCEEELEEITKKRDDSLKKNGPNTSNWDARIVVLRLRLRKLKEDLNLKKIEEMTLKHKNVKGKLAEMKILFDI